MNCPLDKTSELVEVFYDDDITRYRCYCHNYIWLYHNNVLTIDYIKTNILEKHLKNSLTK